MRLFAPAMLTLTLVGCATAPTPPPPQKVECSCAAGCVSACAKPAGGKTTYRKVEREPSATEDAPESEPASAFSPVDAVAYDALSPEDLSAAAKSHSVDPDDVVAGFRGNFARARGEETAFITKSGVSVYGSGGRIARADLGEVDASTVQAVRLVDGRAELALVHRVDGQDWFAVCRVIGEAVARVFVVPADQQIEFVHLGDERAIRAVSSDGIAVYRWNKWEGMFRIPSRAPTSPPRP